MRRTTPLWGLGLLLLQLSPAFADDSGWRYVIDKLVADGVDRARVVAVFQDWRVAPFTGLTFSAAAPRESRRRYRNFLRASTIAAARRCRAQHAAAFEAAERAHGVSADVLAAIFFVESGCGRNTGSQVVLYRLARLAMANEPDNVRRNIKRFAAEGIPTAEIDRKVRARAAYLEATFYPEVRALFEVADRLSISPLDLRGSGSGAFGYPQFLPTSYLAYGVDANGDGRVSLYDTDDAAASCARYFVGHGWRPGAALATRRAVVWQYNRSEAYVDTVLALATRIGGVPPAHTPALLASTHNRPHRQQRGLSKRKRRSVRTGVAA